MPPSAQVLEELASVHRRRQAAVRARALRGLLDLWPALALEDLAGTWPPFEAGVAALVQARHAESAALAVDYYQASRAVHAAAGTATPRLVPTPTAGRLSAELLPVRRNAEKVLRLHRAAPGDLVLTDLAGQVTRLTLEGGRGSLQRSIAADRQALGWARDTGPRACSFCAMLALRGPVYRSEASANLTRTGRRYHAHCSCSVRPVYSRDDPWPERSLELRDLWAESTQGLRGSEARRAFRRALGGPDT